MYVRSRFVLTAVARYFLVSGLVSGSLALLRRLRRLVPLHTLDAYINNADTDIMLAHKNKISCQDVKQMQVEIGLRTHLRAKSFRGVASRVRQPGPPPTHPPPCAA